MGCKSANQKYIEDIIKISSGKVDERIIELIIINTIFEEKDIYYLYKKFIKLEPNEQGCISNNQLLELPEFKYCPFRTHLIRVFQLDKETSNEIKEETKFDHDEMDEANNINPDRGFDSPNSPRKKLNKENKFEMSGNDNKDNSMVKVRTKNQNNNYLNSMDKNNGKRQGKRRQSYIKNPIVVGKQYIEFKKFCEIMKVFNYRCQIEEKIKCIFLKILKIVYFDLFDFDGDGRISPKDLKLFLGVINTKDDKNQVNAESNNIQDFNIESYVDPMILQIQKEIISNHSRNYIDFGDFRNLMWNTNIDKTCVIYLEAE
jgi:Ca2+-binding EF-hand superfamily protein